MKQTPIFIQPIIQSHLDSDGTEAAPFNSSIRLGEGEGWAVVVTALDLLEHCKYLGASNFKHNNRQQLEESGTDDEIRKEKRRRKGESEQMEEYFVSSSTGFRISCLKLACISPLLSSTYRYSHVVNSNALGCVSGELRAACANY